MRSWLRVFAPVNAKLTIRESIAQSPDPTGQNVCRKAKAPFSPRPGGAECGARASLRGFYFVDSVPRTLNASVRKLNRVIARRSVLVFPCLITLILAPLPIPGTAQDRGLHISTVDDIAAEFKSVPCRNKDRQLAVLSLFERMGA